MIIECIHCGMEFNPEEQFHAELGKINECGDCCRDFGYEDNRVKAFINITEEGDFGSISVVSKEEFDKFKRLEELYSDE